MSKNLTINKEKIRGKQAYSAIVLFLVLTIAISFIICLPTVNAQEPQQSPSWIYLSAVPNPVGVGQSMLFVVWTQAVPPITPEDKTLTVTGRPAWTGITLTLTKPDGTKQTIAMPVTDPIGGTWYSYTPDAIGTYSVQANFPGTWKNSTTFKTYYEPAVSSIKEVVVQVEQLQSWSSSALPTSYWTRPIDAALREWNTISGNWLGNGMGNPYTTGPQSAHIVWTKPIFFGGIAGGAFGDISYHTGSAYEAKWSGVVIMQGRLYYNVPLSDSVTSSHGKFVCVDLRTGEQLWTVNGTSLTMGMMYEYDSPNQHGVHPYLWGAGNRVYDPFSGTLLFTITNVPSGTEAVGPNGEKLIYQWDLKAGWLALWNFSAIPSMLLGESGTNFWQWRPVGQTHNGTKGYSWNVTIPKDLPPRGGRDVVRVVYDANGAPEMILCSSGFVDRWITNNPYTMYAISLKLNQRGQLLWSKSYSTPFVNATIDPGYGMVIDPENRVFALPVMQTRQWYGYDLDSGNPLWGPTDSQPDYDLYRMYPLTTAVNGKFYAGGYGGIVHAYDTKTGKLLWTTPTDACGLEGPYEYWPIYSEPVVVDGKLYVTTDEHSHTQPLFRGWKVYCIDAETGAHIWNITGLFPTMALADGYMVSLNAMDNQVYTFGKGPSAITVSASPEISVHGSSVLIKGMVTDQSAGAKEYSLSARFPSGVPAIADEYMTEWMEYVYKQHAIPGDAKGVEVKLTAVDDSGRNFDVGTATSDLTGAYSIMWTPPAQGKYTIIASFAGSDSYFTSYGETALGVESAAATPSPTPTATVNIVPAEVFYAVSAVLIILVLAVAVLLLRKKN